MSTKLPLYLKFYGISPWELEVLYSTLHKLFNVQENPDAAQEEDFTTLLDITFPLSFNDEFFKQFEIQRWEKIKGIVKEMKRRRGGGKSLLAYIRFSGKPNIVFTIDIDDRHSFDTAVDKIDFVLELLPYHLDPKKMPVGIINVSYQFDDMAGRWKIISSSEDQTYHFTENEWKII
ncbi:MAG: hypothetical protein KGH76_01510 [Thaumarchaeota archaeon]|nr:hypothetical protein [Nitrososphaerota archaeon]